MVSNETEALRLASDLVALLFVQSGFLSLADSAMARAVSPTDLAPPH